MTKKATRPRMVGADDQERFIDAIAAGIMLVIRDNSWMRKFPRRRKR